MKRILLITTGGTIASSPTDTGLVPVLDSSDLLKCVPEIASMCYVDAVSPMNLDSTNMNPQHWLTMAECIESNYGAYDGFVIAHGTDTMAYSAAALTYLVQRSPKPIVITGAQKSIISSETDARMNLRDAFLYVVDNRSHGVTIVFDGKVITGARARKSRTKSWNAFDSIDYPPIGVIIDGKILRYIQESVPSDGPVFYRELNPCVFLLKLIPGMDAGVLDYLIGSYDALVIESFGVGGIPYYDGDHFMNGIDNWLAAGKTVVITTQVPHEGSDMSLYQVGLKVKSQFDIIEAYNMTIEAVVTKLMCILAQDKRPGMVHEMFYRPIAHDLLTVD